MSEQRKVVTILFADVVGSTELATQRDPEVVRAMMSRYFKRIGDISAAYGGTVEKFAGDAAMVVFGVPAVHDDDAERAVRAALEIRDGATEISVRVGVNTGEAVTAATGDRQFMVSGDAVNVAARLQQGAEAGEVVVGPLTHQLTRNVIDYEPREPLIAKGKSEPLPAHRALRARTEIPIQARGVPGLHADLVGRTRELRLLLDTFARAAEDRKPHLFTVIGAAGIGKSRLVNEALERLAGTGARVLRGRCLPYGRGITYWPFIEMLRQDTGIDLADERDVALRKLDRWLGELLNDNPQRPAVRSRLAVMLGFDTAEKVMPDTPSDRVEREIGWAMRLYVEAVAKSASLIVVVDDLQWAEPPVLSLVDQLAERVVDVPMLIICVARPEFLESRAGWSAGKPNSTTITLDPLNPDETTTLVSRLLEIEALPEGLRRQIVERSAGTPLFCEEFIHMLIDENLLVRQGPSWRATAAVDKIRVPQGINAVLAARLDLLPERERNALQTASVVGERFGAKELAALLGDTNAESDLDALRKKGLVAGGDGAEEYRFRHLLIRDAAYASLPKSQRAALHDRFCSLLETTSGDPQQITEIIAYHAEAAFTLTQELGLEKALLVERARHALSWLFAMADRVRMRDDIQILEVVLGMLRKAIAVLPEGGDKSIQARLRLLEAQALLTQADYPRAREAALDAAALGEDADLPGIVATARLVDAWIYNWSFEGSIEAFRVACERAIEACGRTQDVSMEIEARHVATNLMWGTGRLSEFVAENEELIHLAESIGDHYHVASITARLVAAELNRGNLEKGHRYLADAEALAAQHGFRDVALRVRFDRAGNLMDRGELAVAESLWREYERAAIEAGAKQHQVSAIRFLGYTLLYAKRPVEAAAVFDRGLELSRATGERWNRSELYALRARAALNSGDIDAADRFIESAVETLRHEDITAVCEVNLHLGMIRAAQHRDAEAEGALRRGFMVLADTDYHSVSLPAGLSLAIFLARSGRTQEARSIGEGCSAIAASRDWHAWDDLFLQLRNALEVEPRTDT